MSLTAAMFVFQACYGTPHDKYLDLLEVNFRVVDADGSPIPDIEIRVQPQAVGDSQTYDWEYLGSTNSTGERECTFYDLGLPNKFRFTDSDSVYAVKDTIVKNIYGTDTIDIVLSKID